MEKLLITRLGQEKTINFVSKKTNKPDSFQKIGFQSDKYSDRWFDFNFRGSHGLVIGQEYDFDLISREYNGKTYWDAKLSKKGDGDFKAELIALEGKFRVELEPIRIDLQRIIKHLSGEDRLDQTSDGGPFPDFDVQHE